jgi:hypothetical protein
VKRAGERRLSIDIGGTIMKFDKSGRARGRFALHGFLAFAVLMAMQAEARVTKIVVATKESPTYSGQAFASVGQYEKLVGTAFGEINPNDPHNAIITDIQFAPRNARGNVEYAATFTLIKPIDMSKGNGVLFYNVVNRGSRNFPYSIGGDPGDGFMQKRGYTQLWSGWQGDVVPLPNAANETVQVPIAKNPDGSSITGPVIFRFWNEPANTTTVALTSVPPGAFTANFYAPARSLREDAGGSYSEWRPETFAGGALYVRRLLLQHSQHNQSAGAKSLLAPRGRGSLVQSGPARGLGNKRDSDPLRHRRQAPVVQIRALRPRRMRFEEE